MKMYGSVINRLMENQENTPEIKVGMMVTQYLWSDRDVFEVVKVNSQKDVVIRRMTAKHNEAFSNDNVELISDENNYSMNVVYRYNNWYEKIQYADGEISYNKIKLVFGRSDYYYDFEF